MEAFKASSVNLHKVTYTHTSLKHWVLIVWSGHEALIIPRTEWNVYLQVLLCFWLKLTIWKSLAVWLIHHDERPPLFWDDFRQSFPPCFHLTEPLIEDSFPPPPPPPNPFSFLKTTFVGRWSWNRFHSVGFLGPVVSIVKKKWYFCCGCQQKGMMQLVWWHWRLLICWLQLLSLYV